MLVNWDNYPNVASGGVYTWAKVLVDSLVDWDFVVFNQLSNANANAKYSVGSNVREVLEVPLFGTQRIEEFYYGSTPMIDKVGRSSQEVIENTFIPAFENFMTCLLADDGKPEEFIRMMMQMRRVLMLNDTKKLLEHERTWEAFMDHLRRDQLYRWMSIKEALVAFGLIQRGLQILSLEVPEVDLIQTSLAWWPSLIGVAAKQEQGVPMVVTEHGVAYRELMLYYNSLLYDEPSKLFWKVFSRNLVEVVYHSADKVAPVCKANAVWEEALGVPRQKIHVVYNGIDTSRFKPMEVKRPAGPTVVSVARVDPFKDTTTLIYAISGMRRKIPDVKCVLYGDGNSLEYSKRCLKAVREQGLEDCFTFAGGTKEPEKAYNVGDVVVFSSITEGFPFSVIEAMACGKAVVATEAGGVPEALEGCGVMVKSRDPATLADAVIKLLTDKELRETYAARALARAREKFSLATMVGEYRSIYSELTEPGRIRRMEMPKAREVEA
ncbi:MAG: GT4 family glycosyltransferase PelF [Thaumarchaeota archaeon]|nr:GT4 family glycosyltransferase PelF [Nitrososphaerota archaeon]